MPDLQYGVEMSIQERQIRILLVDDDEDDYLITSRLLSQTTHHHHHVEWAASYEAALQRFDPDAFDVYLIDYSLGENNGLELLEALLARGCRAPIIILTGQNNSHIDFSAMQTGAADYLVKSQISAPLLERSIRYALQRKQAEEQLRVAEARYRGIFKNAIEGIFQSSLDGRYLTANPALARIYGYNSPEELMDLVQDIENQLYVDPHQRSRFIEQMSRSGVVEHFEAQVYRKDGSVIWVRENARAITDGEGKVLYYEGSVQDISEAKWAQESLQRSKAELEARVVERTYALSQSNERLRAGEARYRAIVEDQTEMVCRFLQDGTLTFANEAFGRYFNGGAPHMIGQNFFALMPEENQAYVRECLARLTPENPASVFEQCVREPGQNGVVRVKWQQWTKRAIFDEDGQFLEYQAVGRDVSELKQAAEALHDRALQQQAVAELGQFALTDSDLPALFDRAVTLISQTLDLDCCLIGQRTTEKGTFDICASSCNHEDYQDQKLRLVDKNTTEIARLLQNRSPLIVPNWAQDTCFQLPPCLGEAKEASGAVVGILGQNDLFGVLLGLSPRPRHFSADDINFLQAISNVLAASVERRQAESAERRAKEEAEAANRAKSEFLSRMSHELRTPLNSILGFGQLLQRSKLEDKQRERLDLMVAAGQHLLQLINEVLDIARVESGRLQFEMKPVPVCEVLNEVLSLMHPLAARYDIALQNTVPSQQWLVRADRQKLRQVLLNLMSNAIKYNRPGGTVDLSVQLAQNEVRIAVQDSGPGIAEEDMPRLFVPFDRLGADQSEVEGTGLGLALSKPIIEAMNGTLDVESTLGQGSTFYVVMPFVGEIVSAANQKVAASQVVAEEAECENTSYTILYIEDNTANLNLVENIFFYQGNVKMIAAMQGGTGLEMAREHRPDLILLDVHLPDINGDEVMRRLQQDPQLRSIPVVVLSADAMPTQAQNLLALGASYYLAKPINVGEFLGIVNGLLRQKEGP